MKPVNIQLLSELGSRRWAVPVLERFHADNNLRFAQVKHALPIGAESLSRTLEYLVQTGWLKRNEGHGHPLRPEYLLTDIGYIAASRAYNIQQSLEKMNIDSTQLTCWSYPVLALMQQGNNRFSDFENALDRATSRAIAQCLKKLVTLGIVDRHVGEEYPPSPKYTLTQNGYILAKSLSGI